MLESLSIKNLKHKNFVVKEKKLEKLQKKLENMGFLNKVAKSYNATKKKN